MKSSIRYFFIGLSLIGSAIFAFAGTEKDMAMDKGMEGTTAEINMDKGLDSLDVATFAGGCFWCVESDFEKVKGVKDAVSGYTGGKTSNPTYKSVSSGGTGHTEAVQVYYDPDVVSYKTLLDVFWRHINPTDAEGQFVDRGAQYRAEIFYHNDKQKTLALVSKSVLEKSGVFDNPIVTPVTEFEIFHKAEAYHQDYYKHNKIRYAFYRRGSGRDQFLEKTWKDVPVKQKMAGKKSNKLASVDDAMDGRMESNMEKTTWTKPVQAKIKEMLTPFEYKVTQEEGTEPPFRNEYWDNKEEGIYVDIVSGEPLFSSNDKFKSGTGWPSFTKPLVSELIVEIKDRKLFMTRTEVRSRYGDSHLGHVFNDGPKPTGLRYCINSAALKFIPKGELAAKGYEKYNSMF